MTVAKVFLFFGGLILLVMIMAPHLKDHPLPVVYWASPSGIAGTGAAFCDAISGTTTPKQFGTVGAAMACVASKGDTLRLRSGVYTGVYTGGR